MIRNGYAILGASAVAMLAASGCDLIWGLHHAHIDDGQTTTTSGSTSSGGGSTTSGSTCGAGTNACTNAGDCFAPGGCIEGMCENGCCVSTNVAKGTTCTDGGGQWCDGNGICVACFVPNDCPAQPSTCVVAACKGGQCETTNAAASTTCTDGGGKVCDGNGTCVECNTDGECTSPNVCDTTQHACALPPSCQGLPETCGPQGNEACCASPLVYGGTFKRSYDGVTQNDGSWPATVSDFRLDRFEITVGRFRAFVAAYPGSKPSAGAGAHPLIQGSGWDSSWDEWLPADQAALNAAPKCGAASSWQTWTETPGANETKPINCITWYEAFAFCAWDRGRLPTEAEWNYAAAGGNEQRVYPWSIPQSSTTIDCSYANYAACSSTSPNTVGSKSPKGDGKWGQADLAGNVPESLFDWSASPYLSPCVDCANLQSGAGRAVRGSGWYGPASNLLVSLRGSRAPHTRAEAGARCARRP